MTATDATEDTEGSVMPSKTETPNPLWRWCHKNRIWSIRTCGHAGCRKDPVSKRHTTRPTEPPR